MHRPLKHIENDIRQCLAETAAAETEQAAAQSFQSLTHHLNAFITRANEMNREHWKLRDTALKQATTIATHDLDEIGHRVGESAPSESHFPAYRTGRHSQQPETLTVQNSPDFFFIRLSHGFINIRHIVDLDVTAKTLYTVNSTRHLSADDVRTLLYHIKLYQAK